SACRPAQIHEMLRIDVVERLDHRAAQLLSNPPALGRAGFDPLDTAVALLRIRQPAQTRQTRSALRFGPDSPLQPWDWCGVPALRGPARILLSFTASRRQSLSSNPVRDLAYS